MKIHSELNEQKDKHTTINRQASIKTGFKTDRQKYRWAPYLVNIIKIIIID